MDKMEDQSVKTVQ